jgi:hypothetical protein
VTPEEFAEVLHAGWAAIPQSHSNGMTATEAVVMALQAMERKAREFQRVHDMQSPPELETTSLDEAMAEHGLYPRGPQPLSTKPMTGEL